MNIGQQIMSDCAKCGPVWHVVLAKVGNAADSVQCRQCGSRHRHKGAAGSGAATTSRGSAARAAPARPATAVPVIVPDLSRPVRTYSVKESFTIADRVNHPSFGLGIVEKVGDGKITVVFGSERRVLAAGR